MGAASGPLLEYGPRPQRRSAVFLRRVQITAFPASAYATFAAFLVVLCSFALLPWWLHLNTLWSKDALRSIGAWFPLVSMLGVLIAWRRLGWRLEGTYWGLVPIVASVPLAHLVMTRFSYVYLAGHEIGVAKLCELFLLCRRWGGAAVRWPLVQQIGSQF